MLLTQSLHSVTEPDLAISCRGGNKRAPRSSSQASVESASIEHVFEQLVDERTPAAGVLFEEDWFDPAWLDESPWLDGIAEPEDTGQVPWSACAPSGWLALETETSYVLTPQQRAALEIRVLPRAGTQTVSQLRATLTRAVPAIDPDGAAARHQARRKDRHTEPMRAQSNTRPTSPADPTDHGQAGRSGHRCGAAHREIAAEGTWRPLLTDPTSYNPDLDPPPF